MIPTVLPHSKHLRPSYECQMINEVWNNGRCLFPQSYEAEKRILCGSGDISRVNARGKSVLTLLNTPQRTDVQLR
jgi:hypothetical protein